MNESHSGNEGTKRVAILLVDFQNEFVKKGGKLHDQVAVTMEKTGMLQNALKLVEFVRKVEGTIIYSPVVMRNTGRFNKLPEEKANEYSSMHGLFTEDTWNCEIIREAEPMNGDHILTDRSDFSAFAGTSLQSILEQKEVNNLFIMGFLTDACILQTSKDAAKLCPDISTYVVSDACASKSMDAHQTALEDISKGTTNVISSAEAESMLADCAAGIEALDGREEWLMINKIFSAAGVGENEKISVDTLQALIGSMASGAALLSILEQAAGTTLSRESMHKILFERKARSGFFNQFALMIIMVLLPISYTVSTRLPFIFLALEITVQREGALWQVGLVLGLYQASRALGNLVIVVFGGRDPFKRLMILQTIFALSGWLFSALYWRDAEQSFFAFLSNNPGDESENNPLKPIWPLFSLVLVGFCEVVVILQRSIMIETAKESPSGIIDEKVLARRLSLQYGMVACGSTFAFIGGGLTYTNYGYTAVCEFGALIQTAQLILSVTYLALSRRDKKKIDGHMLQGNDAIRSIIYHFQAALVIEKHTYDVSRGAGNTNSDDLGMSIAARKAKNDRILIHSLSQLFQSHFIKDKDEITSMEDLLTAIGKSAATSNEMDSKRPTVLAIGKNRLSSLMMSLMKTGGKATLTETQFISYWAPRVYLSMYESTQEANVSVVWPYMKAVVLTQAIAALCIGTFLSTVLLSYTERFGIDAARVGLLLGVGECLGMVTILFKSVSFPWLNKAKKDSPFKAGIFAAILARPLNVPWVLFVASTAAMLFSIDNFIVAVFFQMVLSSVNDLSVSCMNELVGTSLPAEDFRYYQGLGQWLRRLGNMVTAVLGPILFGIDPAFPFVFFGLVVFVWSFILWFLMYQHAERIRQNTVSRSKDVGDGKFEKEYKSCIMRTGIGIPFEPFLETARTPWCVMEQRYFALHKERIEEELNPWQKANVDITLLEHRVRRIAAALKVEKDQRRALEDRVYARVSTFDQTKIV